MKKVLFKTSFVADAVSFLSCRQFHGNIKHAKQSHSSSASNTFTQTAESVLWILNMIVISTLSWLSYDAEVFDSDNTAGFNDLTSSDTRQL